MSELALKEPPIGEFGNWLYSRMRERRMGCRELSRAIGLTPAAISVHLHNQRNITFTSVKTYADYFGEDWHEPYEMTLRDRKLRC